MRTYSEEKRSGTIELLLTSPLTDLEIILGKFLGALALYAAMLGGHADPLRRCSSCSATPSGSRSPTGYLGMLLFGGGFISIGLFISSPTKNQIVAGVVTFAVFLLLWVIDWLARLHRAVHRGRLSTYLSITEHLDDFTKGVIDTKHVVYYLSIIIFGLFLTARSVDTERWRG